MAVNGAGLAQLLGGGPRRGAQPFTEPESLAPPLGGWNTRDTYAQMEPTDAIALDNWYPDFGGVVVRPGAETWLNLKNGASVSTLAEWNGLGGPPSQLIAGSGGALYNATTRGQVVPPAPLASGFTSDWWQWVNFNKRLFLVNGRDPPQSYDGTTMAAAGFSAATGQPPLNVNNFIGVQAIHNRLFFWTGSDCGFWFGNTLAITGTLSYFDFSMLVPSADGGALMNVDVLTYDGGTGIQSYTVFTLTGGMMLTYQGSDPSDPNNWSLVGLYAVAAPVGPRAADRYGGDIYIATTADMTKLSQLIVALKLGQMPPRSKVSNATRNAVQLGRSLLGWQAIYWNFGRRLIFNIPLPSGAYEQYVYNPPLDAWCRWRGLPSLCWVVFNDQLLFGAPNGQICQADQNAASDWTLRIQPAWNAVHWNSVPWQQGQGGVPISAKAQQAWNLFGSPLTKRLALVRPIVQSQSDVDYNFAIGFDYEDPQLLIPVAQADFATSPWDISPWDLSPWSSEAAVEADWQVAGGDGNAMSFAISVQARHPMTWVRTDFRLEQGVAL